MNRIKDLVKDSLLETDLLYGVHLLESDKDVLMFRVDGADYYFQLDRMRLTRSNEENHQYGNDPWGEYALPVYGKQLFGPQGFVYTLGVHYDIDGDEVAFRLVKESDFQNLDMYDLSDEELAENIRLANDDIKAFKKSLYGSDMERLKSKMKELYDTMDYGPLK